jgi:hypothetical protein
MTDPHRPSDTELVEHKSYQIPLSQRDPEWLAAVALLSQHPTQIMAPDREAALLEAYEWNKASFASAEDPA